MGKKAMNVFKHYTHSGHELTDQQFWFIHYYTKLHDRKKAAEKAGYLEGSYGDLNKDYIIEELNYIEGKILNKLEIDTGRIYQELWQLATNFQKDPFGFDIAPADRIKAATELLKRTDDIAQKEKLLKDNEIKVKIVRDYTSIPTDIISDECNDSDE